MRREQEAGRRHMAAISNAYVRKVQEIVEGRQ
jgi:hypothetical protein